MKLPQTFQAYGKSVSVLLVPAIVIVSALALGFSFHARSQEIMQEQLRSHLRTTAAVASLAIDASLVPRVRDEESMDGAAFATLLRQVQNVRLSDDKILYAYIMRKGSDADHLVFVVDADSSLPREELDRDRSGTVEDDEEPAVPGETYDVTGEGFSVLRTDAFQGPAVDTQITQDKWGTYISGYAPIRDAKGETIAVLGVDMDAGEFVSLSQSIFSPIAFLLLTVAGIVLAVYIQYMWHRHTIQTLRQLDSERTALLDLATPQLGMPLATFKWWLEILLAKDPGKFPGRKGICAESQPGVDRMDAIIRSLHDANHLQKGSMGYHPSPVAPEDVIREAIEGMKPDLAKRGQAVRFTKEDDIPSLSIDPKLIGGVIAELIENASMYSPENKDIDVRLGRTKNDVVIEVIDRGYGIAPDEMKSVFQKFKRGKESMKRKPVGNGLGLYIAKGIVDRAGGTIELKSKLGQGTQIRITLPIA